ncbi:PAB8, partial [Symbiodinium sp. CCMP2592]
MERRWRRNGLAVGLLVVVSQINWASVPPAVPRRSAAVTAVLAGHILGSSRSARADGPIEDLQKRLDKFSDELDAMADQYNP